MFVESMEKLYNGADLVIPESFTFDEKVNGYVIVTDLVPMMQRNDVKCPRL